MRVQSKWPKCIKYTLEDSGRVTVLREQRAAASGQGLIKIDQAFIDKANMLRRVIRRADQGGFVNIEWQYLPMFRSLELEIEQLTLTARGSWQAKLDTGAPVELGRGTPEEITARAQRFVLTLTQATSRYGRRPEALVAADLRHADGYAIRLRGVSTLGNDGQKK